MKYQEQLPLILSEPHLHIDNDTECLTRAMCDDIGIDFKDALEHWGISTLYPIVPCEKWWDMVDKIGAWAVEENQQQGYVLFDSYEDSWPLEKSLDDYRDRNYWRYKH